MNFIIAFLSLLLISTNLIKSQKLKLYYNLEFVKDTLNMSTENSSMILLIDKENYLFCSSNLLLKDSLKNNNLEYSHVIMDEEINFMVKNNNKILSKYFLVDENLYVINENAPILNWQIKKQTKVIDNLQCQLATLKYKGRNWEAWFSTKYPISFGPYIFNGLPGIIVELKDTKKHYTFRLEKIKNTEENINYLLNKSSWVDEKSLMINKKQLEKIYLSVYSSPYKRMKEKGILFMIDEKTGEHQPPPDFDKMTKSAQKYIRETNNPIELSEAIKYP